MNLSDLKRQPKRNLVTYAVVAGVAVVCIIMIAHKKTSAPQYDATQLESPAAFMAPIEVEESPTFRTTTRTGIGPSDAVAGPLVSAQLTASSTSGYPSMTSVPRGNARLALAFARAAPLETKTLPAGLPVEISTFMPMNLRPDKPGAMPPVALRKHVFSIGIGVDPQDKRSLPKLSSGLIMSYLNKHFVSVQAILAKDPVTRQLYLYPGLMAATTKYRTAAVTEKMEAAVANAVRDFRCLGHVHSATTSDSNELRRTLVLVQRYDQASRQSTSQTRAVYEVVFIHIRPRNGQMEIHAFVTSHERQQLHYLSNHAKPARMTDCDIQVDVAFVKYSHGGTSPTKSVVRTSTVRGTKNFSLQQLNRLVSSRQLPGDAWDHIPTLLDAIIDGTASPRLSGRPTARPK